MVANTGFAQDIARVDPGALTIGFVLVDNDSKTLSSGHSLTTVATITLVAGLQSSSINSVVESEFETTTDIPKPALAPCLVTGGPLVAGRLISHRRKA